MFVQDLVEAVKLLLGLMDDITTSSEIVKNLPYSKSDFTMEQMLTENVADSMLELAGPMSDSNKHGIRGTNSLPSTMIHKNSASVSMQAKNSNTIFSTYSKAKHAKASAPRNIKVSNYQWTQLPYRVVMELLQLSSIFKTFQHSGSKESEGKNTSDFHSYSPQLSEVLKEVLKTKKNTQAHEMVVRKRDEEFEVYA